MIFSFQGAAKELLSLHVSVYGNYQLLTITGLKRIFNIIMQTKNDHPHITVRAIRSHTYKIIIYFSTLLETLETLHCHPYR